MATVHLDRLRHNARQIQTKLGTKQEIMAIVKANAYGHGAVMVTRTLEGVGIKKFGVATYAEGLELRDAGIKGEIFVLSGLLGDIADFLSNRLCPVIFEMDQLKELVSFVINENRPFNACLKFDTGMGRLGFAPSQIDEIMNLLHKTSLLKIVGIFSHLACADASDLNHSQRQLALFTKLRSIIKERGLTTAKYSLCNSAAILDGGFEDFDWVRPGVILYGCYPSNPRFVGMLDLQPVLELKSKIVHLKTLQPHTTVGYSATFTTQRESKIGFIPIGYADGYPRLASNRGSVLIKGQRAPIVGQISMDLMAIDLTDIDGASLYDNVTLIGQNGPELIRADDIAQWSETICYEIICGIMARVPRVYEGM